MHFEPGGASPIDDDEMLAADAQSARGALHTPEQEGPESPENHGPCSNKDIAELFKDMPENAAGGTAAPTLMLTAAGARSAHTATRAAGGGGGRFRRAAALLGRGPRALTREGIPRRAVQAKPARRRRQSTASLSESA